MNPDDGELWIHPGTVITTVEQEPDLSAFETVLNYVISGGAEAWRGEAELGHFGVDPSVSPSILSGGANPPRGARQSVRSRPGCPALR